MDYCLITSISRLLSFCLSCFLSFFLSRSFQWGAALDEGQGDASAKVSGVCRREVPAALSKEPIYKHATKHTAIVTITLLGDAPSHLNSPNVGQGPAVTGLVLILEVAVEVGPLSVPSAAHRVQDADGLGGEVDLRTDPVAPTDVEGDERAAELEDIGAASPLPDG